MELIFEEPDCCSRPINIFNVDSSDEEAYWLLVCRSLRQISSLVAELLEQSNLTLQCRKPQEPVCASKLPASKCRPRIR